MRILSNNQWKCDVNSPYWQEKGEDCSAVARAPGLVRAYRALAPDVMGLQEVSGRMAALMMDQLTREEPEAGWEYVSGGDTPVVYRRDRLRLLESAFFLYDEAVPGLTGSFNNQETKSYCLCVLEPRSGGRRFAFLSTHLWWKSGRPEAKNYQAGSAEARAYQLALAAKRLQEAMARHDCPGFLVGDLNASIDSLCLERAREEGFADVYRLCPKDARDETRGHHPCGWAGYSRDMTGGFAQAIDHMLVKGNVRVSRFGRLTEPWFDPVSDHYPLFADVELP